MTTQIAPLALGTLLVIGGVDAWLITTFIEGSTSDDQIVTASTGPVLKLQTPIQPPAPVKPIDGYSRILSQPIFFKTRTPYVAPPPPPPPVAVIPAPIIADPGLVLGGIVMNRDVRKIYIFSKGEAQGTWVNEGETFKGWMVQTVDSKSAKLQQQDRTIELHLFPPQ